jgi:hypothetical protein
VTQSQNDITIRSLSGAEELDLFCALTCTLDDELADDLARGLRRPQWMWVALRGGLLAGRAAWWGSGDDAAPSVLDILDVADAPDRIDVGVGLLNRRSAHAQVDVVRTLDHPGPADCVWLHPHRDGRRAGRARRDRAGARAGRTARSQPARKEGGPP